MTFDPFGDFNTAGYLQNSLGLKNPNEVKESEHLAFESSIEDALDYLARLEVIDYDDVLKVHEILFSGFYPWAGKDRNALVPHLAVFKGSPENPRHTTFEHPHYIRPAIDYALRLASNQDGFKNKPGEVMGALAFAHPFLDGNGRTLLLVFMELSYRAGFSIDWGKTNKDEYLSALSEEIAEPSKGHLDKYLNPLIVEISSRNDWPKMIGGIKGLDGLDKDDVTYESLDNPEVQRIYKEDSYFSYRVKKYDND
ncbi:Fic/DOC family protein [Pantoea sp. AS-PWVM4]|uniref:Fic/DOC family protein n=1 Tax=Pantoea sp. AS-PWVM4 TaxID=1332069 RepID=UPI0005674512|nr:Fic family protein [Pantoea sp. AS-PWVM4]